MAETYEHFPLLREETPTEENYGIRYHRRGCSMIYRSRSRNNIRGAAAILTRWPDHWSTFLTYWWIGLGMICLTTFIIYNSLFFFSIYPSANPMPTKIRISTTTHTPRKESTSTHVYMHVVGNYNTTVDFMEYIPLIENIIDNYTTFRYHLIIVLNDTLSKNEEISAEQNNENALNLVLNEDITYTKQMTETGKISIEHVSLAKLMDNSPARKYWRLLSHQFIEFLIRAASIWEKGGIAFNPLVLKSQWSVLYTEKLKSVLENFQNSNKNEDIYIKKKLQLKQNINRNNKKFTKKVNNIRDIINNLENDNNSNYSSYESLIEAENRDSMSVLSVNRKLFSVIETNITDEEFPITYEKIRPMLDYKLIKNNLKSLVDKKFTKEGSLRNIIRKNNNSSSNSLLPSFLDFLYHRNSNNRDIDPQQTKNTGEPTTDSHLTTQTEQPPTGVYEANVKLINSNKLILNPNTSNKLDATVFHPIIIPVKELNTQVDKLKNINISSNINSDLNRITIDINGNIIATETKCHAFLGTIFNYAVHQEREGKLTDFIVTQLSIFCKGVLSSCIGIDLILL